MTFKPLNFIFQFKFFLFEKLDQWVAFTPESEADLAREFDVAQAEALLEGLKAASEPPPAPPREAWPNKHNTTTRMWDNWWGNRSETDQWP